MKIVALRFSCPRERERDVIEFANGMEQNIILSYFGKNIYFRWENRKIWSDGIWSSGLGKSYEKKNNNSEFITHLKKSIIINAKKPTYTVVMSLK